jgi:hypothetical protein
MGISKSDWTIKSSRKTICSSSDRTKASHRTTILPIGRYLMNMRNEGMIMEQTSDLQESYCEPVFSGNWRAEKVFSDRNAEKYKTGYAEFPFTWSSKMQTETASSTTKA